MFLPDQSKQPSRIRARADGLPTPTAISSLPQPHAGSAETRTGSHPGPSRYSAGQIVHGHMFIDLEGHRLCGQCGLPVCGHARDNDGSPACDEFQRSSFSVQRPASLVRTGQGDATRDDAPAVLELWDWLMILTGAAIVLAGLFAFRVL